MGAVINPQVLGILHLASGADTSGATEASMRYEAQRGKTAGTNRKTASGPRFPAPHHALSFVPSTRTIRGPTGKACNTTCLDIPAEAAAGHQDPEEDG